MNLDLEKLLRLYLVEGIGSTRLRLLIGKFRSVDAVFQASEKELMSVERIDFKIARRIKCTSNDTAVENQLRLIEKSRTQVITIWDKEYPENLKKIFDPPAILFVRGKIAREDNCAIAVVGTRIPTTYGKYCADSLSRRLAQKGITIASGMARGIDTIAHHAALSAGGRTIAVLGCGVDVIYPAENNRLYETIIENGAVISEFLMGAKPDAPNFPRRNRIVSGLCLGVLVVEAGKRSGALITANLALEHNREVFAIPGNINSPKSVGCNQLLSEGARLVVQVENIIDELKPQLSHLLKSEKSHPKQLSLSKSEQKMYEYLSTEAIHIDKVATETGLSVPQSLGVLLTLEMKELIRQLPGKYFMRY